MTWPSFHDLPLSPGAALSILVLLGVVVANLRAGRAAWHLPRGEHAFGLAGLVVMINAQYLALVDSRGDAMMGEVVRILYVHVPSAWVSLLVLFFSLLFSIGFLLTSREVFDHLAVACVEVGIVLSINLQLTGMIFGLPTWGIAWTWDPRLVASAIMTLSYVGALALRQSLDDPDRRATWFHVASILASTSIAFNYFSVRYLRSLHQLQSSPDSVGPEYVLILRMAAFAMLFLSVWAVAVRTRIGLARAAAEAPEPLDPEGLDPQGVPA